LEALPDATSARAYAAQALVRLPEGVRKLEQPEPYRVEYSQALLALAEQVRRRPAPTLARDPVHQKKETP
jgi:hypothetical protein